MTYAQTQARAAEMISRKGAQCVWHKVTANVSTAEPWKETSLESEDVPTYVLLLPFDSTARQMLGYAPDALIPAGTALGLLAGGSVVPTLRDTLTIVASGVVYSVNAVDALDPSGATPLMYTLELRL